MSVEEIRLKNRSQLGKFSFSSNESKKNPSKLINKLFCILNRLKTKTNLGEGKCTDIVQMPVVKHKMKWGSSLNGIILRSFEFLVDKKAITTYGKFYQMTEIYFLYMMRSLR